MAAKIIAQLLAALARWGARKRDGDEALLLGLLERRHPEMTVDQLRPVVTQLVDTYEAEFQRKMRARLERDIPRALTIADPAKRGERLDAIRRREAHYTRLRERAMTERAIAHSERVLLREASPEGALWRLGDNVDKHTLDCIAMANKFWPWEVLDKVHPQLHNGCQCKLFGKQEAVTGGYMTEADIRPAADMVAHARDLAQSVPELRHHLNEAALQTFVAAVASGRGVDAAIEQAARHDERLLRESQSFDHRFDAHLHPKDRRGRWRHVPNSPLEAAQRRHAAYVRRWGAADAPTPVAHPSDTHHDDPELLDALDAAQESNVQHLGRELFDHFGQQPIILREKLGEGFAAAVANGDGYYSAQALRDSRFGPSIMEGRGRPKPSVVTEVIEKHPASGQRVELRSPGVSSNADVATVIRHEWFHHVEGFLNQEQRSEYQSLFPRLPGGAFDAERAAREVAPNAGANQIECAAEVFAITTHPDFRASEWEPWVSQAGYAMSELLYQIAEGSR